MELYICHKSYILNTIEERISDILEPPPKQFTIPQMSSIDETFHATHDLIYALQNKAPASQLFKLGNGHKEALSNL